MLRQFVQKKCSDQRLEHVEYDHRVKMFFQDGTGSWTDIIKNVMKLFDGDVGQSQWNFIIICSVYILIYPQTHKKSCEFGVVMVDRNKATRAGRMFDSHYKHFIYRGTVLHKSFKVDTHFTDTQSIQSGCPRVEWGNAKPYDSKKTFQVDPSFFLNFELQLDCLNY